MPERKAESVDGRQKRRRAGEVRDDTCGVCGEKPGLCGPPGRHSLSRHASDRLSFASRATADKLSAPAPSYGLYSFCRASPAPLAAPAKACPLPISCPFAAASRLILCTWLFRLRLETVAHGHVPTPAHTATPERAAALERRRHRLLLL
jgi:hypothetical protein